MEKGKYRWKYSKIGGVTRVDVTTGADIAHLKELDQKLWTVLSCPVDGLEFDGDTLKMLDTDHDGRIRVQEVIAAADDLTGALKNPDILIKPEAELPLDAINAENAHGEALLATAKRILEAAGSDKQTISLEDTSKRLAELAAAAAAGKDAEENVLPYGADTETVLGLAEKLGAKIEDYFLRCRLAAFDTDSTGALDVSTERISAISAKELPTCMDEIATYPLFRVRGGQGLPVNEAVNPAWAADFAQLKALALDKDFPGAESISEADWKAVQGRLSTYVAWKASVNEEANKFLADQQAEAGSVQDLHRFLHLYRDFYHFLKNFVTLADFYSRKEDRLADFQAGKLYIDQRCCELCIKVTDLGRHGDIAGLSGMYLLYLDCHSKVLGQKMTIAAVVTEGSVRMMRVGKNAVFYDRDGLDWDATIVKIIENPISVPQAFWTPYRKLGRWISDKINARVAAKEEESMSNLTAKAENASNDPAAAAQQKPAFDIAKYAGIFAALGMAVGLLVSAFTGLFNGLAKLPWWGVLVVIAGIMLLISGPSMLSAWLKLRRRDLAPVLNANGWAINSRILVNSVFGRTLTSVAKYPKVAVKDPYRKKTSFWKVLCWVIVILALCAAIAIPRVKACRAAKAAEAEAAVEAVEAPATEEATPAETAEPAAAEEVPAGEVI